MRAGQVIAGRYRLEEHIGTGGMGVVWRATDEKLDQVVALKRAVSAPGDNSERTRRKTQREARIAAKLRHPHVVTFIEQVVEGRERWLIMEYVPSQSLAQLLDQADPLAPWQVTRIGAQIASALEAVHAEDIVHRDVKPGNILITEDGTAKLTDFGISRPIYGDVTLTDSGLIGGTVAYLAPEVADGQEATPASDVFALGATLFAAVEGMPPFGTADNPLLVLRRAAAGDLLPVRRAGPLTPVLSALLAPDPQKRPDATAARQLLEELAVIDGADTGEPWWPAGSPGRPQRLWRGFRRRTVIAAGICVAALAIVAGTMVARPAGAPPANPRSALSDVRSADPCALIDEAVLTRFGQTRRESARGNFNRCDVIVKSASGSSVDVKTELESPAQTVDATAGSGPVQVVRQPETSSGCLRTVLLAGQNPVTNRITIIARTVTGPASPDLCAMAEAATTHTVTVLSRGPIARRAVPFQPGSLAWQDACEMLDSGTLTRVLGTGLTSPEIGFGNWECRWRSTTSKSSVTVAFEQEKMTTPPDGQPVTIAGRNAHRVPRAGEPQCDVRVDYRENIVDDAGKLLKEQLMIKFDGPQPSDQLCGPAADLAAVATAKLLSSR